MIELIFVIVIIGVLAGISIPKLILTRDDAAISALVANAKILRSDFQSYYTSHGNNRWRNGTIKDLTSIPLTSNCTALVSDETKITPNTFVLCHSDTICLSFSTVNEGNITISNGTETTDRVCESVKEEIYFTNKTYQLGGITTIR